MRKNWLLGAVMMGIVSFGGLNVSAFEAQEILLNGEYVSEEFTADNQTYYFSFVIPSTGKVELTCQSFRSESKWELLDAELDNTYISEVTGGSATEPKTESKSKYLTAGKYYVRLTDSPYYNYGGNGMVRFKVSYTSAGATEAEPNDNFAQANDLIIGKTVIGVVTDVDHREDFYKLYATENGEYEFKFLHTFDGLNVDVYNEDFEKISAASKVTGGGEATAPKTTTWKANLEKGMYYVKVYDRQTYNDPSGIYNLTVNKEIKLDQVTNVTAPANAIDKNTLTLKWDAVANAEGYQVYMYDSKENTFKAYKSVVGNTCKIEALNPKTEYTFTVAAYVINDGKIVYGEQSKTFSVSTLSAELSKGDTFAKGIGEYKVTNARTNTVSLIGITKETINKLTVPATVKMEGEKYKVTEIATGAIKDVDTLTTLVLGKNVTKVGKNAFRGSSNLNRITFKNPLMKSFGKNAFRGISKTAVINVNNSKINKFTSLLKKTGLNKNVTIK